MRGFDDTVTALAALAAATGCAWAGLRAKGQLRPHWLLLAGRLRAWALAEVTWEIYDVVLQDARPGAVLGRPGLPRRHPPGRRRFARPPGHAPAATGDGGDASWTPWCWPAPCCSLVGRSCSARCGGTRTSAPSGGAVAVAYPFGDVVMVFLAVMALRPLRAGSVGGFGASLAGWWPWLSPTAPTRTWSNGPGLLTGNLVDAGWVVAYLALALGAFGSGLQDLRCPGTVAREAHLVPGRGPLRAHTGGPGRPGGGGLLGRHLDRTGWAMALALSLLAIARQAVGFWGRLAAPGRADGRPMSPDHVSERARGFSEHFSGLAKYEALGGQPAQPGSLGRGASGQEAGLGPHRHGAHVGHGLGRPFGPVPVGQRPASLRPS